MAFTAWAASTAFAVGDVRRATTLQASGLVFKCTTAGTSDTAEPAWPTDIGSTVTDNDVVWTAVSSIHEELATLAPTAIIELFELELDPTLHGSSDILRWHSGVNVDATGNIVWNGNAYTRFPVVAEGFDYTSSGSLPRPTLTVSNLDSAVSAVLLEVNLITTGNDLAGAKVKRIRTLKKFLDGEPNADPYATFPQEIWYVDRKSGENRETVSFELASKLDLAGIKLPKRQVIANNCQWKYRSPECGYTGSAYFDINNNPVAALADDVCSKRLDSCRARFGDNYTDGEVTAGSSTLTIVDTGLNIEVGDTIVGFGVPSGTTVSSASGVTVVMSSAATASTGATYTGTLQTNLYDIILTSVTGLAVGMEVAGPGIRAGTLIASINSLTVTLTQSAILADVATATGTILGEIEDRTGTDGSWIRTYLYSNSVISVGSYIFGPGLPEENAAKITSAAASTNPSYTYQYNVNVSANDTSSSTYTVYTVGSQPSETYELNGSPVYAFQKPVQGLPFGSFPSAGFVR